MLEDFEQVKMENLKVAQCLVFQPYLELKRSDRVDSKCCGKLIQFSITFLQEALAESVVYRG